MKKILLGTVLLVMWAAAGPVTAETNKVPKDLQPLQMNLRWGNVRYSLGEEKMNSYKVLQPYLDRLGDAETSDLIVKARKSEKGSRFFGFLGLVGVGWGLSTLWWGEDKQWKDPEVSWPLFSGLALGLIGNVMHSGAETRKFDAVQRFNSIVRGERQVSLGFGVKDRMAKAEVKVRF